MTLDTSDVFPACLGALEIKLYDTRPQEESFWSPEAAIILVSTKDCDIGADQKDRGLCVCK